MSNDASGVALWKKVVAPTVLVSAIWIAVSCGTWYIVDQMDDDQNLLLNQNRGVIHAAGVMQESLWRLQAVLFEAAEHRGAEGAARQELTAEAKQLEQEFDEALSSASQNVSIPEEKVVIRKIGENFARYRSSVREQLARDGLTPEESADLVYAAMSTARAVAEPCEALAELGQKLTNDTFDRRDRLRTKVNMVRMVFIIIGPAIGILLGLRAARSLNSSLSQISVTLRDASGGLEQEIGLLEVNASDEEGGLPALQQQVQFVSGRIKQVVEELQWTRRKAEHSERLAVVGELAAGIAHEVRNPLTSVKLLIQAIERNQSLGDSDQQRLRIVRQEIARIETTMQELLDYAKPAKLRRVRHDVRDTLRRTLNLVEVRAQQSGVAIDELLGSRPLFVNADPEQLQQVFVNLLLNAIEAMPAGGRLLLALEGRPAASGDSCSTDFGPLLRIVFRDSGCGIRADVLERLFQPFVTSKERGIGLGLAISRQIMLEHGGRLTACNVPGGGAEFVVEVPLANTALIVDRADDAAGDPSQARTAAEQSRAEENETADHR